jgi:hypothetical protein
VLFLLAVKDSLFEDVASTFVNQEVSLPDRTKSTPQPLVEIVVDELV